MKLHQILFLLLIFFLPIQLGKHFWPDSSLVLGIRTDYLAPTIYFTDLLAASALFLWAWTERKKGIFQIGNWLKRYWWIGVFFFYLLITSFLAQNSGAAVYKFIKILELFLLGLYVAKNAQPLKNLTAKLLMAVVFYESLIALLQVFRQSSLNGFFWWLGERTFTAGTPGIALADLNGQLFLRAYGTFSHPNSLAGFLLVTLILIWGLGKEASFWPKFFVSLLGLLAIIFSFSQVVWLVGVLILSITVSRLLSARLKNSTPYYLLPITYLIVFFLIFFLFPKDLNSQTIQERMQLIKSSVFMFQTSPLSGVGLNNFIVHLPNYWLATQSRLLQPVHNLFFLTAAETGLVGLFVFLWFLLLAAKRTLVINQYYLLLSLLVILLTGLFDHYWLTLQQNILLGAIVFGSIWSKMEA